MQLLDAQTRRRPPAIRSHYRAAVRIALVSFVWLVIVGAYAASNASALSTPVAATGGAKYFSADSGGVQPNAPVEESPAKKKKSRARRKAMAPVITGSELTAATLLDEGRPITLRYRVKARTRKVRVRLIVRTAGGKFVRTVELGVHTTKVLQSTELTQAELGVARAGTYKLRLTVTDGKGRRAARAAGVEPWLKFQFADHRFPVVGQFSFGGDGARFGAGRPGHIHQGQDVVADAGTPLVAPHAGTISWVKYQASGAGYYVVLHSTDGRDYVFMHLVEGSTAVKQGDVVPTGKLIGRVGATGDASGPHLHFEVWVGGPWQFGGHAVDPLPLLKAWYASAPGGALQTASIAGGLPLDND
jgi:murein DD-endopeptidase MepM/ murein hydrolase activator NlpD